MKLEPGIRIRDFELIRPLGEGGMGEVWLAREDILDRQVAIKRLNPIYTQDPDFVMRFRNEARIQAQLTHENIVGLISFFNEGDMHYMVMQYAPGTTLKSLIEKTGPIREKYSLHILKQILSALEYAHSKGIVHRDIKPSNIMIDIDNKDRVRVQVMDFGIARLMTEAHLTRTGTKMGTLFYMSPEQVMAQKDIDHRSDIYSLGVVLYEMLCGQVAYNVDTNSDFLVQKAIVDTPIPDPRKVYEFISNSSAMLVQAMTAKDREQRISVKQILEKIEDIRYLGDSEYKLSGPHKRYGDEPYYDSSSKFKDGATDSALQDEIIKHTKKIPFILAISNYVFFLIFIIIYGFPTHNSTIFFFYFGPPTIDLFISLLHDNKHKYINRLWTSAGLYWVSSALAGLLAVMSASEYKYYYRYYADKPTTIILPFFIFLFTQVIARILEKSLVTKKINLSANQQNSIQTLKTRKVLKSLLVVSIIMCSLVVIFSILGVRI